MSSYTLVKRPSVALMGLACRTSNAPDAGPHDIPKHWERFYSENVAKRIPNKASDEILALYCDYEGNHTQPYSLIVGCPVNAIDVIPEGMVTKVIPEGTYAHFQAIGEQPKSLIETWDEIWQTELQRTYTGDYEVYGAGFTSKSPQEIEIFIAIDA